jgi:hypothetical protein
MILEAAARLSEAAESTSSIARNSLINSKRFRKAAAAVDAGKLELPLDCFFSDAASLLMAGSTLASLPLAGELVAGKLVAGKLVAGKLVAGKLVAGKLVAGELVAGELVAVKSTTVFSLRA